MKIVNLTLLNGTGYIFDVEDYMWIREKYRLVGALVGTSGMHKLAVNDKTFPVELNKWETNLLLDLKIAVLVSKRDSLLNSTIAAQELYRKNIDVRLQQQKDKLKQEKIQDVKRNLEKIVIGKRKKFIQQGDVASSINLNPSDILEEIEKNFKFDANNALLEIPMSYNAPHIGCIVNFSADDSFKYQVFRDLWERGKFVTSGEAFGGDFLVYPGDPILYHAAYIVVLIPNGKLNVLDLIAKVRTSVIVNKMCLFAMKSGNDHSPNISYQTVLWEGSRDKQASLKYTKKDEFNK